MSCSRYELRYGTGGVLSATYLNCGDMTRMTLDVTGGVSGNSYGVIIATTGTVTTYTGFASAGGAPVPGYTYEYVIKPWAAYVNSASVSASALHGLP